MSEMDRRQFLQGMGASIATAILRAKQGTAPETNLPIDQEQPAWELVTEYVSPWGPDYGGAGNIVPWTLTLWTHQHFDLGEIIPIAITAGALRFAGTAKVECIDRDTGRGCGMIYFVGVDPLESHINVASLS